MSLRVAILMISISLLGLSCKKEEAPVQTPAPPPASVKGQASDPAVKPVADTMKEPAAEPAGKPETATPSGEPVAGSQSPQKADAGEAKTAKPDASAVQPGAQPAKAEQPSADNERPEEVKGSEGERPAEAKTEPQKLQVVPPVPVKLPEGAAGAGEDPAPQGTAPAAAPTTGTPSAAAAAPVVATVASSGAPAGGATWTPPPFQNVEEGRTEVRSREAMVKMLQTGYRHAITDERVLKAMGTVPRHEYLLPENRADGYKQNWFRIGHGQTITDPGMVAWMTQLLAIKATDKVLEIGTGSGYQGSVLAQLTPHAYTIEIVEPLAQRTHKLFARLGLDKVLKTRIGDGYYGWEEEAPFDKIIVTCAADHIPVLLLQQLKPGGLMVIPVGPRYQPGKLHFIAKDAQGKIHKKVLGKVDFVPMTRLKDWGKTDERDAKRKELEKQSREFKYEEATP